MKPKKKRKPAIRQAKQLRAQTTVDAILAGATHVLVHQGYDLATTNRIAKAAGVSIGSLYQYFPDKEAILAELIERKFVSVFRDFTDKLQAVGSLPLQEGIRLLVCAVIETRKVEPALRRVYDEQIPKIGKLSRLRQYQLEAAKLTAAYFESKGSELSVSDFETAAYIAVQAVEGAIHACFYERIELVSNGTLEDELVAMVWGYLTAGRSGRIATRPT